MFQQSEVVSLLLAAALTPVMYSGVRHVEFAGKRALMLALGALLGAYLFTVLETFVLPDAFNVAEHASLAVAGLAFAVSVVELALSERRGDDAP